MAITTRRPRSQRRRLNGFTLIELLVGMALGLITTVIIAQVIVTADGNRQTTTTGNDAQVNGALALYTLNREVQGAGYGLISHSAGLGCPIRAKFGNSAELSDLLLAPVTLVTTNGVLRVRTLTAGRSSFAVPMSIKADHAQGGSSFTVNATMGVNLNDVMIAVPAAWKRADASLWQDADMWCTAFQAAANVATTLTDTAVPHVPAATSWNPAVASTLMPKDGYAAGSYLVNLGSLVLREFWLQNQNLMMRELKSEGTWDTEQTVATGIVAMQALYGKDTSTTKDGIVDVYNATAPSSADDWARVLTVRVALVARSSTREKEAVTTTDPRWDVGKSAAVTGSAACPDDAERQCLTLTAPRANVNDTEWQHYRYKVYDTVSPLRNVLWSAV
jgi:type IV pilus assembly protein PilW